MCSPKKSVCRRGIPYQQRYAMPTFVQMLSFYSARQRFDEKKDTGRLNEVMKELQEKGAKLLDKVSLAGNAAVYVITYQADSPLVITDRQAHRQPSTSTRFLLNPNMRSEELE